MFSPRKTRYRVREEGAGCKYLFLEEWMTTCNIKGKIWAGSKYLSISERWLTTCVLKGKICTWYAYFVGWMMIYNMRLYRQDMLAILSFCGRWSKSINLLWKKQFCRIWIIMPTKYICFHVEKFPEKKCKENVFTSKPDATCIWE